MAFADAKLPVTELLGSLSLATDLGTGQPLGHGLSTSLLAVEVARELGCDDAQIRSRPAGLADPLPRLHFGL